jgi:hypothetical protein
VDEVGIERRIAQIGVMGEVVAPVFTNRGKHRQPEKDFEYSLDEAIVPRSSMSEIVEQISEPPLSNPNSRNGGEERDDAASCGHKNSYSDNNPEQSSRQKTVPQGILF